MPISQDLITEIRDRADIVSIIGEYVQLRQRGRNYVGLCPFHTEKTPSFNVSPELGIYKCFGCGKSGDVFTFLQDYAGMSFIEAVRHIASGLGISIPTDAETPSPATERRRQLLRVLAAARDYFQSQLNNHPAAQQFIRERGLSQPMLDRFQLGAAPAQWTSLCETLQQQGYSTDLLSEAGLIITREESRPYDRFRNRVMFPIWNIAGDVIGFAGRALTDSNDEPKYINSPQTPLYDKSATLYALNFARHAIVRQHYVFIVEGYMDAIALHSVGIEHCVATCGTALTERHLEVLHRLTDRVVLVFDGDTAGWNAAYRALSLTLRSGMAVEIVILPEGEDPDSLVRRRGAEIARQQLAKHLSAVEFMVTWSKRSHDWTNPHTARTQIRALADTVLSVPDGIYRELLLRELSDRVGIHAELLARSSTTPPPPQTQRPRHRTIRIATEPITLPASPVFLRSEEIALLQAVLFSRKAAHTLFDDYLFDPATLPTPEARELMHALSTFIKTDSSDRAPGRALPELHLPENIRSLAEWLAFTCELPSPRWSKFGVELDSETYFLQLLDDAVGKLDVRQIDERIAELQQQLEQQPNNLELLRQIVDMNKLRIKLLNRTQ